MDKKKLEQIRYRTKFEVVKNSITRINPEFSLCTILVAYHGDNRNHSSISKEIFEKCLWTIYGIPIVGEWVQKEEDPTKNTWGSHGGRIILDDQGIRYEQTTKPFGFVTEEAYKNATWVEVLEKDGHTKNEYLKLERCILWNSRYEECNSILDDNFGQSMELQVNEGYYREEDYYFVIEDFTFSALCILGTAEPCFESAMIGRQYELSQFKKEFQLMMEEYKRLNAESNPALKNNDPQDPTEPADAGSGGQGVNTVEPADGEAPAHAVQNNSIEEEGVELGEILFSEVCANIKEQIAKHVFRYRTGKSYEKYFILAINEADKTITIVDREALYAAFKVPYVASQTKNDGLIVNLDFDNKAELVLGAVEKTEAVFSGIGDEVAMFAKDASEYDVGIHNTAEITNLTAQLASVTSKYETAQSKIVELEGHLAIFEREKKQYMEQKHRDIIDALVASRRDEMGKFSEYLEYCVDMETKYAKTVEEVEKDLKEIHYNFMLKAQPGSKKSFSGIEIPVANGTGLEGSAIAERYGADMAKYFSN